MDRLKIFKALSDETRLNIVDFLTDGEKCVCEIIPHTKRKQSTISIQLAKLENLGVLKSRRDGRKVYYKLSDESIKKIIKII
ncbi:MAG: metalloregulator ArsR/SmtB family transcription factor [Candidatus Aenigmatarchaeota archaeon]